MLRKATSVEDKEPTEVRECRGAREVKEGQEGVDDAVHHEVDEDEENARAICTRRVMSMMKMMKRTGTLYL